MTYSAQKADLAVVQQATTPPKLTPQKRTSVARTPRRRMRRPKMRRPRRRRPHLRSKTSVRKKLEDPYSLKSNEMAECSL